MLDTQPTVAHVYQNSTIDSTRWNLFSPRADDIVIATPYRCGTTWMQVIVMHLIFQDLEPRSTAASPWLDHRQRPIAKVLGRLDAQKHRRVIKSHLPLDGLRFFPALRYIVVSRDPRDVFMSLWTYYSNMTPTYLKVKNHAPGYDGRPLPPPPADIREFWRGWITRGWFDWETEGYPFWSNLRHVRTWWDFRRLPNIYFVHYNDLLTDLAGQIARLAAFLDINISSEMVAGIAEKASFAGMRQNAGKIVPAVPGAFEDGASTFINKGTNGRWRGVLTSDDLALYDAAVKRELPPDLAAWIEAGGPLPV